MAEVRGGGRQTSLINEKRGNVTGLGSSLEGHEQLIRSREFGPALHPPTLISSYHTQIGCRIHCAPCVRAKTAKKRVSNDWLVGVTSDRDCIYIFREREEAGKLVPRMLSCANGWNDKTTIRLRSGGETVCRAG